jgi:hypothetical protein
LWRALEILPRFECTPFGDGMSYASYMPGDIERQAAILKTEKVLLKQRMNDAFKITREQQKTASAVIDESLCFSPPRSESVTHFQVFVPVP